jgi:beta-lactamase class D
MHRVCWLPIALIALTAHSPVASSAEHAAAAKSSACFLLWEIGVGEVRRNPSEACRTRVSPASTFKIPHALAALDTGVISSIDETIAYDGKATSRELWRRDHTLRSAMHYSVLWYFQRIAERLGPARESEYLHRLAYGNEDSSSGLTTFWLGQSLQITPEEQQAFLLRLYAGNLPIKKAAIDAVKTTLIQPRGVVMNAAGANPFNAPWPEDVVVSTKTGSANDTSGRGIRWLIGHVQRGTHAFIFVSCVVGTRELDANAAIELAARSLRNDRVL